MISDYLKNSVTRVPDYPKAGIQFRDITSLVADGRAFAEAVTALAEPYLSQAVDKVVGIEARGFVFGAALARELGVGLALARKPGKLPRATCRETYTLEYGEDALHMHLDALEPESRVLLVDDLIATGGTALAALRLVRQLGASPIGAAFVIALPELGGLAALQRQRVATHHLMEFAGE
ncbi:adenine phosphoribosyltransferase [Gilvimarinus algae]|uniref:Adenine phosphoribosyltransferase n=1 Tax=Gilvimarinus algae TaxID=3058037 RepID=A0ABT8TI32_9GAMM|nr:adenine phosphoribosyltransferase [Gilvimarinus sp. SDUM040014]MDO3382346.1 adenine phosphoribosyltransferase [Gilvimarinus sp. SDUM040014]